MLDLAHISVGDIFRWHIQSHTKLGARIKRIMAEGQLVPDDLVEEVVKQRLDQHDWNYGFILDGFPRNSKTTEPRSRQLNTLPEKLRDLLEKCIDQDLKHRLSSFDAVLRVLSDTAVFPKGQPDAEARRAEATRQRQEREAEERRQREERQRQQRELAQRQQERRKQEESRRVRPPAEERQLRESQERERRQAAAARRKPMGCRPWALALGAVARHPWALALGAMPRRRWALTLGAIALPFLLCWAAAIVPVVLWNARTPAGNSPKHVPIVTARPVAGQSYTNSVGMTFVWIPPGRFVMGSPDGKYPPGVPAEQDRDTGETPHRVTLTRGFHMATCLVTQRQWEQVMGADANHSQFMAKDDDEKNKLPVDSVSWDDSQAFCGELGAWEGRKYRLPTDAEWEYACRAGTTTPFWCGNTITTDQANFNGFEGYGKDPPRGLYRGRPTPVDAFARTRGASMTCTATCGNGARTIRAAQKPRSNRSHRPASFAAAALRVSGRNLGIWGEVLPLRLPRLGRSPLPLERRRLPRRPVPGLNGPTA